ncbi:MAG: response regulator [Burkholderiaceae bacterium]
MTDLAELESGTSGREALAAAAVQLLDQLGGGDSKSTRGRRRRWRSRVSAGLVAIGARARGSGLPALAAVVEPVGMYLVSPDSGGLRARSIEPWVGALISICAGSGTLADTDLLLAAPEQWPRFGDQQRGAQLRDAGVGLAREVEMLSDGGRPNRALPPVLALGHDALELLAESASALDEETQALAADPRRAIAHLADRMPGFGLACRHVGLAVLEPLFVASARRLSAVATGESGSLDDRWLAWSEHWQQWFTSPGPDSLARALALHADGGVADAGMLTAVREQLSRVLISAEPTPAEDESGPVDPWSRAIPIDADPEVADELRQELPAAMSDLEQAVSALTGGDHDGLDEARRLAHTIKGAANTVGLSGIATIAHWLEDLLDRHGRGEAVDEILAEASDVLAESIESIDRPEPLSDLSRDAIRRLAAERGSTLVPEPDYASAAQAVDAGPAPDVDPDQTPASISSDTDDEPPGHDACAATSRVVEQPADALAKANEALAILALAEESVASMRALRRSLRGSDERLQTLADELERLADRAEHEPANLSAEAIDDLAGNGPVEVPERFDPLDFERRASLPSVARRIAETATDNRQIDRSLAERIEAIGEQIERLGQVQNALRESALRARMLPAARLTARLQRVCRQSARMTDRDVQLLIEGEATLVDGDSLHRLAEPLAHLIRNAVVHGIEPAATRVARGKPPAGRVLVSFASVTGWLSVTVQDDGAGLDLVAIAERARALHLLADDLAIDAGAAEQLILAPGFSTRAKADQLSGRGVGLDVVNQAVRSMRGSLQVRSRPGQGLNVQIDLPLEMMLRPLFVVRCRHHVLALSTRGVRALQADVEAVQWRDGVGRYDAGGRAIEVRSLESVLGLPAHALATDEARAPMLLRIEVPGGRECALVVPDPGPARPALVRELSAYMPRLPGIDGAAVLGDGAIAPVLDLPELISTAADTPTALPLPEPAAPLPLCLVVDDSVSVRRATTQFLADLGFDTDAADNGRHALERLRQRRPDLLVVDLEMPEMDGLALTRAVRELPGAQRLPIIMITSRASSRVRALAMEAGANHFLAKPFSEDELAALVVGILR